MYLIIIADMLVGAAPNWEGVLPTLLSRHDGVWFLSRPFVVRAWLGGGGSQPSRAECGCSRPSDGRLPGGHGKGGLFMLDTLPNVASPRLHPPHRPDQHPLRAPLSARPRSAPSSWSAPSRRCWCRGTWASWRGTRAIPSS